MCNRIYFTLVNLLILFQFTLGGGEAIAKEQNNKQKVIPVIEPKDKVLNLTSYGDTLSKVKNLTDKSFPIIILGLSNTVRAFKQVKKWGVTYVDSYGMGSTIEN